MGNINLKLKVKMTETECADGINCLVTAATADCPVVDLTLAGLDDTAQEALDTNVAAYTDGYKATVKLTYGETFHTDVLGADQEFAVAMGRNGDSDCTYSKCTQGFFTLHGAYTHSGNTLALESYWNEYDTDANDAIDGDAVQLSGDSNLIYGAADVVATSDTIDAAEETQSVTFYMSKEADVEEGTTSMSTNGDRWDKGSTLVVGGGAAADMTASTSACTAKTDELELGAASLVAGSVALAAALAF